MAAYGGKNWSRLWQKLEQEGNIGIDYVINPYLYSEIAKFLIKHPSSKVVDFGAGTNILAIQFMYGYQAVVPGLKTIKDIQKARDHVSVFMGLEGSRELVTQAQRYLRDLGYPPNIKAQQFEIAKGKITPFKAGSVALTISRNFLMHLEAQELEYHLGEVYKVLRSEGRYITAFLNPDYEQDKFLKQQGSKHRLVTNEKYSFTHGAHGEHGTFYHYWKDIKTYEVLFKQYFIIRKKIKCIPIIDRYKKEYPRYYKKNLPLAFVYILEKR